jgi:hypothetical protein
MHLTLASKTVYFAGLSLALVYRVALPEANLVAYPKGTV